MTPGFRPVCVFGELEPPLDGRADGTAEDAYVAAGLNDEAPVTVCDGDERVLLMVNLMPSEDDFTMYSLLLLPPPPPVDDAGDAAAAAAAVAAACLVLPSTGSDPGSPSPACCADFSLSMTALSELLRHLAAAAAIAAAAWLGVILLVSTLEMAASTRSCW